jgi:REP-associated tyrosine transposase
MLCTLAPVMRFPRVKAQGEGFYHCISGFVDGLFIFGTSDGRCSEAEEFLSLMRRRAAFSGIQILDYILMNNHYHLVCKVPEPKALTQSELLERIEAGDGPERAQALRQQLARYAEQPDGLEQSQRLLESYRRRTYDISIFNKELKGGFAQGYNRRHQRYGVLWAERFKSVLLEGGRAVKTISAYIELNPVRAGLCEDPKEYRYCGYAEAMAQGSEIALEGIRTLLGLPETASRQEIERAYRQLLHLKGAEATEDNPPAIDSAAGQDVVEREKVELSPDERLRCKIRCFSDGVILGSRSFVEFHWQRLKQRIRHKCTSGPIALDILGAAALWVLRKLRVRAFA